MLPSNSKDRLTWTYHSYSVCNKRLNRRADVRIVSDAESSEKGSRGIQLLIEIHRKRNERSRINFTNWYKKKHQN